MNQLINVCIDIVINLQNNLLTKQCINRQYIKKVIQRQINLSIKQYIYKAMYRQSKVSTKQYVDNAIYKQM